MLYKALNIIDDSPFTICNRYYRESYSRSPAAIRFLISLKFQIGCISPAMIWTRSFL